MLSDQSGWSFMQGDNIALISAVPEPPSASLPDCGGLGLLVTQPQRRG